VLRRDRFELLPLPAFTLKQQVDTRLHVTVGLRQSLLCGGLAEAHGFKASAAVTAAASTAVPK
jgi:hypothetical protein